MEGRKERDDGWVRAVSGARGVFLAGGPACARRGAGEMIWRAGPRWPWWARRAGCGERGALGRCGAGERGRELGRGRRPDAWERAQGKRGSAQEKEKGKRAKRERWASAAGLDC